jgi:hypothetical protein
MCPACITTVAVVAASSASGAGVLGFLLLKFRSSRCFNASRQLPKTYEKLSL